MAVKKIMCFIRAAQEVRRHGRDSSREGKTETELSCNYSVFRMFEKPLRQLFKEIGLTANYLSHPSPIGLTADYLSHPSSHFRNGGPHRLLFFFLH